MFHSKYYYIAFFLMHAFLVSGVSAKNIVITDSGIKVSRVELENAIKYWPKGMRESAISNNTVRYDLLSHFMVNRKIAEELINISEADDPEFYWQREFAIRNLQNKLYINYFKKTLKVPDMTKLAKERVLTSRDKYLKLPEQRQASHILLLCRVGCERPEKRLEAKKLLKKLKNGANFEALVEEFSGDPGSKARKGKLARWIKLGEPKVDPYFVEGVYSIDKKGGYSNVIETKFGLHIIRLDDIKEVSYEPEDKVLPTIIKGLEEKYRSMSERVFTNKLVLSSDAVIDNLALDEILAKYKPKNRKAEPENNGELRIEQFTRP